jgi:hypothetical protein
LKTEKIGKPFDIQSHFVARQGTAPLAFYLLQ